MLFVVDDDNNNICMYNLILYTKKKHFTFCNLNLNLSDGEIKMKSLNLMIFFLSFLYTYKFFNRTKAF